MYLPKDDVQQHPTGCMAANFESMDFSTVWQIGDEVIESFRAFPTSKKLGMYLNHSRLLEIQQNFMRACHFVHLAALCVGV